MNAKEFFLTVAQMREAQKQYFKNRFSADLEKAKELERIIDAEIERVKKLTEPLQTKLNL